MDQIDKILIPGKYAVHDFSLLGDLAAKQVTDAVTEFTRLPALARIQIDRTVNNMISGFKDLGVNLSGPTE